MTIGYHYKLYRVGQLHSEPRVLEFGGCARLTSASRAELIFNYFQSASSYWFPILSPITSRQPHLGIPLQHPQWQHQRPLVSAASTLLPSVKPPWVSASLQQPRSVPSPPKHRLHLLPQSVVQPTSKTPPILYLPSPTSLASQKRRSPSRNLLSCARRLSDLRARNEKSLVCHHG